MIDPGLPLIDLHRHLEGTVKLATILELADQHHIPLPAQDVEDLRPLIQVDEPEDDLMAFLARFRWITAVLADLDACRRIAYENVQQGAEEGLDYLELRFSPWFMAEPHGLEPAAVVEAVADGIAAGRRDFALETSLIGTLSRTYGPQSCTLELEALLSHRDQLVAIDLAGDEVGFPAHLFCSHFRKAHELGLAITVHAGEAAGARSVWSAVDDLGARRIGHCVRAMDDPALLDHLAEHRIGLEINLTSNVQTRSVESYGTHPIAMFLERGLLASLNTDDPTLSGIDLRHELEVAAPKANLGPLQIEQTCRNALDSAFLSAERKKEIAVRAARRSS